MWLRPTEDQESQGRQGPGATGRGTLLGRIASILLGCAALTGLAAEAPDDASPGTEPAPAAVDGDSGIHTNNIEETEVVTAAEERTLEGADDPMQFSEAMREVERAAEKPGAPARTASFEIYGSFRARYRLQGSQDDWQDGGSRIGGMAELELPRNSFLFGRYEAGFNLLTGLESLSGRGENTGEFEDSIFTRLGYGGLNTPRVRLVVGKNWSAYYEIAGFTDRFMGTGASASGVFNAATDGGETGTGRADNAVQAKLTVDFLPKDYFEPFELYLQGQHGNPIPFGEGQEYGPAMGISAVAATKRNFALSMAYNHAQIDLNESPELRELGLTGSSRACLIGTRAFGDRWYAGLVVSRLLDHETTDEGIYFDGWGSEFYGEFHLFDKLWLVGGYNLLEPDSDQAQANDYEIRYGVAEIRYTFDGFRRMLFANVRIDDGRTADGHSLPDIYTFGIRWDLSNRGFKLSR